MSSAQGATAGHAALTAHHRGTLYPRSRLTFTQSTSSTR